MQIKKEETTKVKEILKFTQIKIKLKIVIEKK